MGAECNGDEQLDLVLRRDFQRVFSELVPPHARNPDRSLPERSGGERLYILRKKEQQKNHYQTMIFIYYKTLGDFP